MAFSGFFYFCLLLQGVFTFPLTTETNTLDFSVSTLQPNEFQTNKNSEFSIVQSESATTENVLSQVNPETLKPDETGHSFLSSIPTTLSSLVFEEVESVTSSTQPKSNLVKQSEAIENEATFVILTTPESFQSSELQNENQELVKDIKSSDLAVKPPETTILPVVIESASLSDEPTTNNQQTESIEPKSESLLEVPVPKENSDSQNTTTETTILYQSKPINISTVSPNSEINQTESITQFSITTVPQVISVNDSINSPKELFQNLDSEKEIYFVQKSSTEISEDKSNADTTIITPEQASISVKSDELIETESVVLNVQTSTVTPTIDQTNLITLNTENHISTTPLYESLIRLEVAAQSSPESFTEAKLPSASESQPETILVTSTLASELMTIYENPTPNDSIKLEETNVPITTETSVSVAQTGLPESTSSKVVEVSAAPVLTSTTESTPNPERKVIVISISRQIRRYKSSNNKTLHNTTSIANQMPTSVALANTGVHQCTTTIHVVLAAALVVIFNNLKPL